jgi:HD-GYP domain-containing protein (c-di-GMP phosphodiesterase class II)
MTATAQGDVHAMRTIRALALAVDDKDRYTRNHSERVALYATAVAVHIGLPIEHIERAAIAGTLHDVGKVAVPDSVLLKPGPLSDDEFALVQRHSEAGERTVLALGHEEVATWIRHHHERWDGDGYPDGLAGERIPLPSRIIGVADALDAMTTARAYSEALSLEQAKRELVDEAGKQFDPQVTDCLIELLGNGTLSMSQEQRVVTCYTLTPVNGDLASADHQRIRRALFPGGDRRHTNGRPRISVASSI